MDFKYKYNQLAQAVKQMDAAYEEAVKNRSNQSKWVAFNSCRNKVKELLKPKAVSQATIEWLGR